MQYYNETDGLSIQAQIFYGVTPVSEADISREYIDPVDSLLFENAEEALDI